MSNEHVEPGMLVRFKEDGSWITACLIGGVWHATLSGNLIVDESSTGIVVDANTTFGHDNGPLAHIIFSGGLFVGVVARYFDETFERVPND